MYKAQFQTQVSLLVQCLPLLAQVKTFALKGGTALNLFVQDLPRLSVDIDLTYLPLQDRQKSLNGITQGLFTLNMLPTRKHRLRSNPI